MTAVTTHQRDSCILLFLLWMFFLQVLLLALRVALIVNVFLCILKILNLWASHFVSELSSSFKRFRYGIFLFYFIFFSFDKEYKLISFNVKTRSFFRHFVQNASSESFSLSSTTIPIVKSTKSFNNSFWHVFFT